MDVCMSMADGHEPRSDACAGLSVEDRETLDRVAAEVLDARGVIVMINDAVGRVLGSTGGSVADYIRERFGIDLKAKAEEATEAALWRAQSAAIWGPTP